MVYVYLSRLLQQLQQQQQQQQQQELQQQHGALQRALLGACS